MNAILPMIVVLLAAPAMADVVPLTQARSIRARWTGNDETITAPGFDPFMASVGEIDFGIGNFGGIASQDSTIAPDRFDYAGGVRAYRPMGLAESNYAVGFRVDSPQTYVFDARVLFPDFFGSGVLRSRLSGAGGTIFDLTAFNNVGNDNPVHVSGLLEAGEYTLTITYRLTGISTSAVLIGDGVASMIFTPVPQCIADFNQDEAVNSADLFAFLDAFFAIRPSADINEDTLVNSLDFFEFVTAFFAGC